MDFRYEPVVTPKLTNKSSKLRSFEVETHCFEKISIIENQSRYETKFLIDKKNEYRRVSRKNTTKDIKEFVCPYSYDESVKVRQRIIALQKLKSVSGIPFKFKF